MLYLVSQTSTSIAQARGNVTLTHKKLLETVIVSTYNSKIGLFTDSDACAKKFNSIRKQSNTILPLIPKIGPWDGCLIHAKVFFLTCAPIACAKPIVVVLLPSPKGVGVILGNNRRLHYITLPSGDKKNWALELWNPSKKKPFTLHHTLVIHPLRNRK